MKRITTFTCPDCGSKFEVSKVEESNEKNLLVCNSCEKNDIEKESNIHISKNKSNMKAQERINELQKKGIGNDFFALSSGSGDGFIFKMVSGIPVAVTDAELDELEKSVVSNGYIKSSYLWRRWVMSQYFRMESPDRDFSKSLTSKGYKYQWKMILNELKVLRHIERKDVDAFHERYAWFDKALVVSMITDYTYQLSKKVESKEVLMHNGRPYKKIGNKCIYLENINKGVFEKYEKLQLDASMAYSISQLIDIVSKMYSMLSFYRGMKQCKEWRQAYIGAGSYEVLKNLVMFHDVHIFEDTCKLSTDESIEHLARKNYKYASDNEGWRMMGLLRKTVTDNGFDFHKRMEEIYSEK